MPLGATSTAEGELAALENKYQPASSGGHWPAVQCCNAVTTILGATPVTVDFGLAMTNKTCHQQTKVV